MYGWHENIIFTYWKEEEKEDMENWILNLKITTISISYL
jgi:hypothetical protein